MNNVNLPAQQLLAGFYKKFLGSPESLISNGPSLEFLRREIYEIESDWVAAEEQKVEVESLPKGKKEFIEWYVMMERKMNLDIHFFIEFLRGQASLKQIAYYICMEELVDGSFDDLMATVQLGMPIEPKMVAGRNYWDEMGNGDFSRVHTSMFKESSNHMRKVLKRLGISVEQPTLECLMNGNMLLMWSMRREYNVRLIGAIGLVEGSAPVRFRATTEGLERLKQPDNVIAYHKAHIGIDACHSRAWLEVVLEHYGNCGSEVIREMGLGVAIRYNVALRYYNHMYDLMRGLDND
ncbi:iron-containing redox enzyme family protein [Pseudomonas sp. CM25]|uniref:iron-containing redox enzyme family protein n=1 Tax=Pseudomonas sp. CM25 TaxID=2738448 RepID=UPI001555D704|nr:iron-containing redox enzyme family protein [Pseudomonas sp. CM25]NQD56489.1 iron-containing redox enzyme family protein [Pseudomonas sp. CM25]